MKRVDRVDDFVVSPRKAQNYLTAEEAGACLGLAKD